MWGDRLVYERGCSHHDLGLKGLDPLQRACEDRCLYALPGPCRALRFRAIGRADSPRNCLKKVGELEELRAASK